MTDPTNGDDKPLDPEAQKIVTRVRWMMLISAATTLVAVVAVLGVVGYRMMRSDPGAAAPDVTGLLPRDARIVTTAVSGDRLVVTLDVRGTIEIRTYDLQTLRPVGRLRFATEP